MTPDDAALERWFRLEMSALMQGLVRTPRPLNELLLEREPAAATRGGAPYRFDRQALAAFAGRLTSLTRAGLRVPIFFHLDAETPGDAFVADEDAARAPQEVAAVGREPRDGRLWIGRPLARQLSNQYPTLFQFVPR